jgi:hypothetical protein
MVKDATHITLVQFGSNSCSAFSFSLILSLLLYNCFEIKRSGTPNADKLVMIEDSMYMHDSNIPFLKNYETQQICFYE